MHNFYPSFDERIKNIEPITNLISALSALGYADSSRAWLIARGTYSLADQPPYILHEHFYNRTGEFASADMVPITAELEEELLSYTEGLPYMGGRDDSIRSLIKGEQDPFLAAITREAEALKKKLPHSHDSNYDFVSGAFAAHKAVSINSSLGSMKVAIGANFKNSSGVLMIVTFDGKVFDQETYNNVYGELQRKFFDEHVKEQMTQTM